MARQSLPVGAGLGATHRENGLVLIEMFVNSDDLCEKACHDGISVGTHTVFATRPLPPDAEVITVFLTKLPCYVPTPEFEDEVRSYMDQFARVLETTFFTEPNGGWFQGRGKVVLDTTGVENNFEHLVLNLHLPGSDASFHATWKSMVIWPATAHACPIDFPKEAEDDRYSPIGYDPENGYRQLPLQQSFRCPRSERAHPATPKISTAMDVTMAETLSSSTTGSASMMLDLRERPTSPMLKSLWEAHWRFIFDDTVYTRDSLTLCH
ncbi:hypothetical protein Unana1_00531 [Umbelopsis nana]